MNARLRRCLPWWCCSLVAGALALADAPVSVHAGAPTAAVQRNESTVRGVGETSLRRAPKSLAYIYGEEPTQQDPETPEGGDGGTNSGGEGTGDANKPGDPFPGSIHGYDHSDDTPLVIASVFNADQLFDPDLGTALDLGRRTGNQALCFCVDTGTAGWASAPGYGNDWDMRAVWSASVADSTVPALVRVRFAANHDLEPGADVLRLEVARNDATQWQVLREISGTNAGPTGAAPLIVDELFTVQPSDFTGPTGDEVRLRLRVLTDRIGSDEDGLWPSDGAAQIDDIRVWIDGVLVSQADFETTGSGFDLWAPQAVAPAGDFLKLMVLTEDLDPCRRNVTYQFGFVDDGTPPTNDPSGIGTGGAISAAWSYGPGGYVVNYDGGVSEENTPLNNALRTGAFAWDLPGTDDDGLWGGQLEFGIFRHLPLENGIFYFWSVRSFAAGAWSAWRDFGDVYYEPSAPHYARVILDVSRLLVAEPESVQVQLGVVDMAEELGLPGTDATPAPFFDNIAFAKFQLDGPVIGIRDVDRFQDGFPTSGSAAFDGAPEDLAIRLDAARDIAPGAVNVPADSMVVTVRTLLPGSTLAGPPELEVLLRAHPRFDGVRVLPTGFVAIGSVPGVCGGVAMTLYAGTIVGQPVTTSSGNLVPDAWFFDLPDGPAHPSAGWQTAETAFFFPGDELRWYVRAQDNLGNASTYPEDVAGFTDFDADATYPARVVGLPTLGGTVPTDPVVQPPVLVIDDTGDFDEGALIELSLAQIGHHRGCQVDVYRVLAAGSGAGNGIGSALAHGATAAQLAGYSTILYFAGEQGNFLLSDGSGAPLHDDGDDLGAIDQWRTQVDGATAAYFGNDLVSGLQRGGSAGSAFVRGVLGVELIGEDVRDLIDAQVSPRVAPLGTNFTTEFVIGGCYGSDQFDAIAPLSGALSTHAFVDPQGNVGGGYPAFAGVAHTVGDSTVSTHVTFPFSFASIQEPLARDGSGLSARARLLQELLGSFGRIGGTPTGTPAHPPRRAVLESNVPNPFNPRTTFSFVLPGAERVELSVYDLSGRRVRTLLDEPRAAGRHSVVWDGRDDRGSDVASGVYLVQMRAGDDHAQRKVALIR